MFNKMNVFDWVAFVLVVVGALNWGFVGFFGFNLVSFFFGDMTAIARIVYGLVGLSAVYIIYRAATCGCKSCG